MRLKGGSEPAREGVGTFNINGVCHTAFASKPAPTKARISTVEMWERAYQFFVRLGYFFATITARIGAGSPSIVLL